MPDPRSADIRYPVVFRAPEGGAAPGTLAIAGRSIQLTGRGAEAGAIELSIECGEIRRVRIGRDPDERINGYATVVLERRDQPPVLVAPVGMHLLHEIAGLVTSVTELPQERRERIDLIVPVKPACERRVRRLIADGPPFDPSRFEEHHVYLGEKDVVFTFVGPAVRQTLRQTLWTPELWRAGLDWRRCIDGSPRTAPADYRPERGRELIFSWPPRIKTG